SDRPADELTFRSRKTGICPDHGDEPLGRSQGTGRPCLAPCQRCRQLYHGRQPRRGRGLCSALTRAIDEPAGFKRIFQCAGKLVRFQCRRYNFRTIPSPGGRLLDDREKVDSRPQSMGPAMSTSAEVVESRNAMTAIPAPSERFSIYADCVEEALRFKWYES